MIVVNFSINLKCETFATLVPRCTLKVDISTFKPYMVIMVIIMIIMIMMVIIIMMMVIIIMMMVIIMMMTIMIIMMMTTMITWCPTS